MSLARPCLRPAALAALLAAASALGGCSLLLPRPPRPPTAEQVRVTTADGWEIAVTRYRPDGPPSGPPVLVCHGISVNARSVDLDEAHSLTRWLAGRGRDAFAVDLRGTGDSHGADPREGRPFGYTIDTYAQQDIPAVLARIQELTGSASVDYVGHSMGGLIGYIYLARGGQGLNTLVTLGSPVRFVISGELEQVVKRAGREVWPRVARLDVPAAAWISFPIFASPDSWSSRLLYNPENFSTQSWETLVSVGLAPISGAVLQQFGLWIERGAMLSADGSLDYLALLGQVRVPALVVAGKLDRLAGAMAVRPAYDALGGEKRFLIAGEENGFAHDYGHLDLVLGDRAPEELWPRVHAFQQAHLPR